MYDAPSLLQDQIPRKLLPSQRKSLKCQHQSHLWLLRLVYKSDNLGKRRYNLKIWKYFVDVFNAMPIMALIDEKILCMHGGLSPDLHSVNDLCNIKRPIEIPDEGLLCDVLWSDPDPHISGWGEN